MTISALHLANLIGSRLCHDLISPVGAIQNGLELISMTGGQTGPELELIADSCTNATAKIKFFRLAFGNSQSAQGIGRAELEQMVDDYFRTTKLKIIWRSKQDVSRSEAQICLLGLMCCETALPFGGKVMVDYSNTRWTIAATGSKMRIDDDLWKYLSHAGPTPPLTAALAHFAMLASRSASDDRPIKISTDTDTLAITV